MTFFDSTNDNNKSLQPIRVNSYSHFACLFAFTLCFSLFLHFCLLLLLLLLRWSFSKFYNYKVVAWHCCCWYYNIGQQFLHKQNKYTQTNFNFKKENMKYRTRWWLNSKPKKHICSLCLFFSIEISSSTVNVFASLNFNWRRVEFLSIFLFFVTWNGW